MRIGLFCLCLLSSGCAFAPQIKRVAVDHNQVVANSSNELTLVNILRARDREPLHFTSIGKLFGDANISGTASSSLAIKGGTETETFGADDVLTESQNVAGTEVLTPNLSVTMGGKSSLDVAVYDSQEFYQGITSSLSPGVIAHYLHQGWSDELFTYLFVSQVDFVVSEKAAEDPAVKAAFPDGVPAYFRPGRVVETLVNDPDDEESRGDFEDFVNCYRLTHYPRPGENHKLVPLAGLPLTLEELAILDGEKFDVDEVSAPGEPAKARWIKRKGKGGDALGLRGVGDHYRRGEARRCEGTLPAAVQPGAVQPGAVATATKVQKFIPVYESGAEGQAPQVSKDFRLDAAADTEENDHEGGIARGEYLVLAGTGSQQTTVRLPVDVQVVLRSIDGVIYFLGEYLRAQETPYRVQADGEYVPIVNVTTQRPQQTFVSTRFKGERYYVPASPHGRMTHSGRSSQVFALIQQLVNLQKTAKERPTTQTVRVLD